MFGTGNLILFHFDQTLTMVQLTRSQKASKSRNDVFRANLLSDDIRPTLLRIKIRKLTMSNLSKSSLLAQVQQK